MAALPAPPARDARLARDVARLARHGRDRPRHLVAIVAVVAVAALAAACAKGPESAKPVPTVGTAPPPTSGDVCVDPIGDLAADEEGSVLAAEPAGVDLTKAEAAISGTTLQITFTAAGDVASAPEPLFVMAQGDTGRDVSFELRAQPATVDPTQPWTLTLVTYRAGFGEQRTALKAPVSVSGRTVSYSVALTDIPTISTLLWQWGSSSTSPEGEVLVDDCSTLGQPQGSGTTVPPSGSVPPGAAPSTTIPPGIVGDTLTAAGTVQVTVHEVQSPTTSTKALAVPASPGTFLAAVDVEVCAIGRGVQVGPELVTVKTTDNRQYPFWNVPDSPNDPALVVRVVAAGECLRGWVVFQLPDGARIARVEFDLSGRGRGPYLVWKVS